MQEDDVRSGRVALLTAALLNERDPGLDTLAVLETEGWGVVGLPADDYPETVSEALLDQAAEQAAEFARHRYLLAGVGEPSRALIAALAAHGVGPLPWIAPRHDDDLRAFLRALTSTPLA